MGRRAACCPQGTACDKAPEKERIEGKRLECD